MNNENMMALLQLLRLGTELAADYQSGEMTDEEFQIRFKAMQDRLKEANAMWDSI